MEDITSIITIITIFFIGYFWGKSKKKLPKREDINYQEKYNEGYIKGYLDSSKRMMEIIDDESEKQIKKGRRYYDDFPSMGIN